ncbi:MAG: hypothetical protein J1F71_04975, partial [Clostridiales bacterium]|nr:hypothetical protein [Clostridiales bacterium]
MNEKDKQIEQLFDEYASTLEPNERLADKARQSMRTNKGETKKRTWHAGLVAACAAVVATVLIIVPIFAVNIFSGGNNSSGGGTLAPEVHSYSISEIKANRVDADFAVDYLSTELPVGADIFSENYYACYIKQTGEFVYLKAVFGIEYNGGNIQMSVIAEKAGYAGSELA